MPHVICQQCARLFYAKPNDLAKGWSKVCSHTCKVLYEKQHGRVLHEIERFWHWVEKTPGCWLWTAARDKDGYGLFTNNKRKLVRAHRFAYELTFGAILARSFMVCHRCDTPPCVRPEHLFLGSHDDNLYDAARKGRIGIKLTREDIQTIVLLARRLPQHKIAAQFGISQSYVSVLIRLSRR